jgi:hypothetical protein
MYLRHYTWDLVCLHLLPLEIVNPHLYLHKFFSDIISLPYVEKILRDWFTSLIADSCLLSRDRLVNVIEIRPELLKLMEAASIIQSNEKAKYDKLNSDMRKQGAMVIQGELFEDNRNE